MGSAGMRRRVRRCARPHGQFLRSYAVPALQDCKLVVVARMRCGEGGEDLSERVRTHPARAAVAHAVLESTRGPVLGRT